MEKKLICKCPNCGNEMNGKFVCGKCGYDESKDYGRYLSLSQLTQDELVVRTRKTEPDTVLNGMVGREWQIFSNMAQTGLSSLHENDAVKIIQQLKVQYQSMISQYSQINMTGVSSCRIGTAARMGRCSTQESQYWLKALADIGEPETKYQKGKRDNLTGNCWYFGLDREQNYSKAFSYYKTGKIYGDADAMNSMGNCYFYGHGTKHDVKKAFDCYQAAANKNHVDGMYNLAHCYREGIGTAINNVMAKKWEQLAKKIEGRK